VGGPELLFLLFLFLPAPRHIVNSLTLSLPA